MKEKDSYNMCKRLADVQVGEARDRVLLEHSLKEKQQNIYSGLRSDDARTTMRSLAKRSRLKAP